MAEYDTPAMLSHVMEVTGQDMLYYIGHSMGTITYYTACSYHPWIARATRLMVEYGGNMEVLHVKSPVFCILADLVLNQRVGIGCLHTYRLHVRSAKSGEIIITKMLKSVMSHFRETGPQ